MARVRARLLLIVNFFLGSPTLPRKRRDVVSTVRLRLLVLDDHRRVGAFGQEPGGRNRLSQDYISGPQPGQIKKEWMFDHV